MHKLNKLHHILDIAHCYLLTGKIFFHLTKFTEFSFKFKKLFIFTIYFIYKKKKYNITYSFR